MRLERRTTPSRAALLLAPVAAIAGTLLVASLLVPQLKVGVNETLVRPFAGLVLLNAPGGSGRSRKLATVLQVLLSARWLSAGWKLPTGTPIGWPL